MIFTKKHIEIHIPDDEWRCPKCGIGVEEFYIESDIDDTDCDLFHSSNYVICNKCGWGWTLSSIIKKWRKNQNMIKCMCCKGTGYIKS